MALNRSDKSRILRRYFPGMTRNSEMSTEPSTYPLLEVVLAIAAYALGISVLAISGRELRRWRTVIPTFLGMNLLIVLTFMMWLNQGIPLMLTKVSAVALVCLAAFVLFGYIKRNEEPS